MKFSRTGMVRIPDQPCIRSRGRRLRAVPAEPVHHRQSLAEHMHTSKLAAFKDWRAHLRFEERQPGKHDHLRAEVNGVSHELVCKTERRVGQYHLDADR